MDALILSCGTGGGHNSAGRAVMEELAARNHRVTMMNPYTLYGEGLAEKIDGLYISTAQKAPGAFGAIYRAGELYRKLPFRSPVYHVNMRMVPIMQEYLAAHHYDIIIMPHLFPAEILTQMKRRGMEVPGTIFIATDYCCIPFTEETECDAYVIPSAELEEDFSGRGIPAEKLYPYGIPVGRDYRMKRREDGRAARGDGCEPVPGKRYILVSGGSMGAGKMESLVGMLLTDMEDREFMGLIVVCGSNRELYWKLKRKYGTRIVVVGHTDRMADYLRVSSLYITKPGGLSSTEAAVCGVPLLHMPPIPGCETFNARYFRDHGLGVGYRVPEEGAELALRLLDREDIRREMVDCQLRYVPEDAAVKICDLAERMADCPGCVPCFNGHKFA